MREERRGEEEAANKRLKGTGKGKKEWKIA